MTMEVLEWVAIDITVLAIVAAIAVRVMRATLAKLAATDKPPTDPLVFQYVNYRGEREQRVVMPTGLRFGVSDWHLEPAWLMEATDLQKNARREFDLTRMTDVRCVDQTQALGALAGTSQSAAEMNDPDKPVWVNDMPRSMREYVLPVLAENNRLVHRVQDLLVSNNEMLQAARDARAKLVDNDHYSQSVRLDLSERRLITEALGLYSMHGPMDHADTVDRLVRKMRPETDGD